jgi:O-acetyl-ADP-ribose deacetylase (regulator of RNase III)
MPIEIVHADITTLDVDAIVNAANSALMGGSGVDGAIHRAAGPSLVAASMALAPCAPGDAVITPGFQLRARWVIHTVGPVWHGGARGEPGVLRRAYERCFEVARERVDIRSIAFPSISTGAYGYPRELAAGIALDVMRANAPHFDRVVACVFDAGAAGIYQRALAGAE